MQTTFAQESAVSFPARPTFHCLLCVMTMAFPRQALLLAHRALQVATLYIPQSTKHLQTKTGIQNGEVESWISLKMMLDGQVFFRMNLDIDDMRFKCRILDLDTMFTCR